jgi:hypothetical protein
MRLLSILLLTISTAIILKGQQYPNTPPEVSPMPMKPEMTEIWNPEVPVVVPGDKPSDPPSDATILFNGNDLDQWESKKIKGKPAPWKIVDNEYMEVVPGTGDIQTKLKFGDCQLHLEWSAPDLVESQGQGRGNSGVFLQDRYEVQILDSYRNRTYKNGQAASIYKDYPPMVNAMKAPQEWNTYDIIYKAPRFTNQGTVDYPATITVLHNGVLVQNHAIVHGLTLYSGLHIYGDPHGDDVISLQDHGNKVQFRNIWIRKL